jgi:hypothetical protein
VRGPDLLPIGDVAASGSGRININFLTFPTLGPSFSGAMTAISGRPLYFPTEEPGSRAIQDFQCRFILNLAMTHGELFSLPIQRSSRSWAFGVCESAQNSSIEPGDKDEFLLRHPAPMVINASNDHLHCRQTERQAVNPFCLPSSRVSSVERKGMIWKCQIQRYFYDIT